MGRPNREPTNRSQDALPIMSTCGSISSTSPVPCLLNNGSESSVIPNAWNKIFNRSHHTIIWSRAEVCRRGTNYVDLSRLPTTASHGSWPTAVRVLEIPFLNTKLPRQPGPCPPPTFPSPHIAPASDLLTALERNISLGLIWNHEQSTHSPVYSVFVRLQLTIPLKHRTPPP